MPQSTGTQTILQQNERGIHVTPVYHSIRVLNPFFQKKKVHKRRPAALKQQFFKHSVHTQVQAASIKLAQKMKIVMNVDPT